MAIAVWGWLMTRVARLKNGGGRVRTICGGTERTKPQQIELNKNLSSVNCVLGLKPTLRGGKLASISTNAEEMGA
jgi:hypothetical protein